MFKRYLFLRIIFFSLIVLIFSLTTNGGFWRALEAFGYGTQVTPTATVVSGPTPAQVQGSAGTSVTITWTTSEPTDTRLRYSTQLNAISSDTFTSGSEVEVMTSTVQTTAHTITLTGLTDYTHYYYRIVYYPIGSSTVQFPMGGSIMDFTTSSWTSTPIQVVVSNLTATNVTSKTATITWQTNVETETRVRYGKTPPDSVPLTTFSGTGVDEITIAAPTINHSLELTNLDPNTTYYYRVTRYIPSNAVLYVPGSVTVEFPSDIKTFTTLPSSASTPSPFGYSSSPTPTPTPTPTPSPTPTPTPTPTPSPTPTPTPTPSPTPTPTPSRTPSSFGYGTIPVSSSLTPTPTFGYGTAIPLTAHVAQPLIPSPVSQEKRREPSPDEQIVAIRETARRLVNEVKVEQLLEEVETLRNKVREQETQIKYLQSLTKGIAETIDAKVEQALTTFITYGVDDTTKRLGAGERAAVLASYKEAFDKLPETEEEFSDALKIANGRFPSQRSEEAEESARTAFKKVYKRVLNTENAGDENAIVIIAYGLRQRPENRNLASERAALKTFRRIYRKLPQTTTEWNILQAITYSGATR